MRQSVLYLAAAVLGAALVVGFQNSGSWLNAATAQVKAPRNAPARTTFPTTAVSQTDAPVEERLVFQPPRAYNADGLTPDEAASVYVNESNERSVCNIATRIGNERVMFLANPTEDSGSGFVLDLDGHILTNFHVVENAQRIKVTLFNGDSYEADPVGVDPLNDMAVIRIKAPQEALYPVRIGDSASLKVGMNVYAIGNPFGLERTMTTGIISSLNRTLPVTRARSIKSVIQIDAAINPGNSGGPLLNSHGELIGMNTAIASKTGQNSGIGFAIPANLIRRVVPELIQHGKVQRPDSGILEVMRTQEGLRILRLEPDGPAARAGLRGPEVTRTKRGIFVLESEDRKAADLVVGVNGKKTLQVDEFLSEVESNRPGDQITIEVIRGNEKISVPVTLK